MASQTFDAMELLRDELCETDLQIQSEAMKRLHLVARAIGPARARDELISYLKHLCSSKIEGKMDGRLEDELLMLLAVEVKSLPPHLGGPEHAHLLVSGILETLCAADETVVREKAVESLNHVISILPEDSLDIINGSTGIIRSLSDADKSFQCHISCAGLLATTYARSSAVIRPTLRNILKQLALDEMPLVRAAVFVALGDVAVEMEPAHLIPEIVVLFETLSKDHQEIVRETAVEVLLKLSALSSSGIPASSISDALSGIPNDRSVKLRSDLAKNIVQFSKHLGRDVSQTSLFPLFVSLLRDQDAEVRSLAACNIGDFAVSLESDSLPEQLAVAARALSTDPNVKVKLELAVGIGPLASALGSSGCMVHLVPIINTLLADEQASIKDKAIRSVHTLFAVCGPEILDSPFFQNVMKMQKDAQWRVRHALLEFLPEVASRITLADFDHRFTHLLRDFMNDRFERCPHEYLAVVLFRSCFLLPFSPSFAPSI
jgi:serine/threonine-protein phosphatase 2A regulatory subunit A